MVTVGAQIIRGGETYQITAKGRNAKKVIQNFGVVYDGLFPRVVEKPKGK